MKFISKYILPFLLLLLPLCLYGLKFNYCIKKINGKTFYVSNGMKFVSFEELLDYYNGRSDPGHRITRMRSQTTPIPEYSITLDSKKLNKRFLKQINRYRKKHGSPSLEYNETIAKAAQDWANYCATRDQDRYDMDTKYNTNSGEFLPNDAKNAIKIWYGENAKHDYDEDTYRYESRHFGTLIWKKTKQMGCGFSKGSKKVFVVCKFGPYDPQTTGFKENVNRPKQK